MPKIDRQSLQPYERAVYPGDLRQRTKGYSKLKLSDAGSLTNFGLGEVTLEPSSASGIYHWHTLEDELIYVLEGEVTVIEGGTVYTLVPGDCATFKAGVKIGHTVENRSDSVARFLELGTRNTAEFCIYPGIDMQFRRDSEHMFEHRDGTPVDPQATPATLDEPDSYSNKNPKA